MINGTYSQRNKCLISAKNEWLREKLNVNEELEKNSERVQPYLVCTSSSLLETQARWETREQNQVLKTSETTLQSNKKYCSDLIVLIVEV